MGRFAEEAISTLIRAKEAGPGAGAIHVALEFDIYLPESV